jgi:hypothetical protein
MPSEHRRSLTDSLRRILDRNKDARSEPAVPSEPLLPLSLQSLLRHAHVLAAAGEDASELQAAQAEVDRRLVDAQQDADIASLHDAARALERRRLMLEAEREGFGSDRLLRRPRPRRPPEDEEDRGCGGVCMCSLQPAPDEGFSRLGASKRGGSDARRGQ